MIAFEDKSLRETITFFLAYSGWLRFLFTLTCPQKNDFSLMEFQEDSYDTIEQLTVERRKT